MLSEWAFYADPNSEVSQSRKQLKGIIEFPFRNSDDTPLTQEQFDALTDEEAFNLCCKGVIEGEVDGNSQSTHAFDISRMAYQLEFKNMNGIYTNCKICNN